MQGSFTNETCQDYESDYACSFHGYSIHGIVCDSLKIVGMFSDAHGSFFKFDFIIVYKSSLDINTNIDMRKYKILGAWIVQFSFKNIILFYEYRCFAWMYDSAPNGILVPTEARKGILWIYRYEQL